MEKERARRWQIKKMLFEDWEELPGYFTAYEVIQKKLQGEFCVAMPVHPSQLDEPIEGALKPSRPSPSAIERNPQHLTSQAEALLGKLRPQLELLWLPAVFPHVLNELAALWATPEEVRGYFEKTLFDQRWGRQGFPLDAFQELVLLYDTYWEIYSIGVRGAEPNQRLSK
jgi:hypothetical protein